MHIFNLNNNKKEKKKSKLKFKKKQKREKVVFRLAEVEKLLGILKKKKKKCHSSLWKHFSSVHTLMFWFLPLLLPLQTKLSCSTATHCYRSPLRQKDSDITNSRDTGRERQSLSNCITHRSSSDRSLCHTSPLLHHCIS